MIMPVEMDGSSGHYCPELLVSGARETDVAGIR